MVRAHRELILKWLDGANIQVKTRNDGWRDISYPGFLPHNEYRVKPEKLRYTRHSIADHLHHFALTGSPNKVLKVYAEVFKLDLNEMEII